MRFPLKYVRNAASHHRSVQKCAPPRFSWYALFCKTSPNALPSTPIPTPSAGRCWRVSG
ncbi:hypothetical protein DIPPA_06637 [Diplonema papillatum]|nr:hypothetical protein DIPPA_06637 [Diplonema papillatum]